MCTVQWQSDTDSGERNYSEKYRSQFLSTTNCIWNELVSNSGFYGERPGTNGLSLGRAPPDFRTTILDEQQFVSAKRPLTFQIENVIAPSVALITTDNTSIGPLLQSITSEVRVTCCHPLVSVNCMIRVRSLQRAAENKLHYRRKHRYSLGCFIMTLTAIWRTYA